MENDTSINNLSLIKNENIENKYEENYQESNSPLFFSDQNEHILCCSCKKNTPLIQFQNKNMDKIICSCQCFEGIQEYTIEDFIGLFSINLNNDQILKCNKHINNKYIGYCEKYKINICEICLVEYSKENIILFDSLQSDITKYINNLKEVFKLDGNFEQGIDILDLSYIQGEYFLMLISMIINDYEKYPNYNLIKNIENIYKISENLIKSDDNSLDKLDVKKILDIKSKHEYDELNGSDETKLMIINSINITQTNFYNIKKLCELKLINLKELNLSDNNIDNIEPLIKAPFINLENLDLSKNKIDDKNIPYIKEFKFDKLKILNFYFNYFTEYEFFNSIENFKNLLGLSVGSNRFREDIEEIVNNRIQFNLKSIRKFHAINGVFTEKTIKIIKNFMLDNLKEIYLDGNNIDSLEFINDVNWPNVKKIYLNQNKIMNIKPLTKLKQFEIIELKDNKIIYNKEFEELINSMEKLTEITISGNILKIK